MQKIDIRKIKSDIRQDSKVYRISLSENEKRSLDNIIFEKLISLESVIKAKTILCYMSTSIEVDTKCFINKMLEMGKTVAVPRCIDNTRNMEFYCITSLDQTEKHTFGVLEPIPQTCPKLRDFRNSVCILPGLSFDNEGYRLGYGKGYYDRFLSSYKGTKIGICYENCIKEKLPHGFFDVPADIILTEKQELFMK